MSDDLDIQLNIQEKNVPLTYEDHIVPELVDIVVNTFGPFKDWVAKMSDGQVAAQLDVRSVHIQSVDTYGPTVAFVKFRAEVYGPGNKFVSGITFMRGASVAILVILQSELDGKEYAVITSQARVPIGTHASFEIPAGVLSGDGSFVGAAARELKEETGLEIKEAQLICLSDLAFGNKAPGIYPSPGACDEFIKMYLYRKKVSQEFITNLEGRVTGLEEEGERITVKVLPLADLWHSCPDGKSIAAYCLYTQLLAANRIPTVSQ